MSEDISLLVLRNFQRLAYTMDNRFRIPFTRYRIGWDFLLGLIPVAGDLVSALISISLLLGARKYKLPLRIQLKMLLNIGIDFLLGSVPLIGNIFDATWKANSKNVTLLLDFIEKSRVSNGKQ